MNPANVANSSTEDTVEFQGDVHRQIHELRVETEHLGEVLNNLAGRLQPVIPPILASAGSNEVFPRPALSPVANSLYSIREQIMQLRLGVCDLLDQVQV